MIRGIEKRRIVDDGHDRKEFVRRLGVLAEDTRTPVYAWALLSNHVRISLNSAGHFAPLRPGVSRQSGRGIGAKRRWEFCS
jgi:hypothetical protein